MAKSLELPKGKYSCQKMKSHDSSKLVFIAIGDKVVGKYAPIIIVGKPFFAEGSHFRDTITTSYVKDFNIKEGNKVEIITENSVYLLQELFD